MWLVPITTIRSACWALDSHPPRLPRPMPAAPLPRRWSIRGRRPSASMPQPAPRRGWRRRRSAPTLSPLAVGESSSAEGYRVRVRRWSKKLARRRGWPPHLLARPSGDQSGPHTACSCPPRSKIQGVRPRSNDRRTTHRQCASGRLPETLQFVCEPATRPQLLPFDRPAVAATSVHLDRCPISGLDHSASPRILSFCASKERFSESRRRYGPCRVRDAPAKLL